MAQCELFVTALNRNIFTYFLLTHNRVMRCLVLVVFPEMTYKLFRCLSMRPSLCAPVCVMSTFSNLSLRVHWADVDETWHILRVWGHYFYKAEFWIWVYALLRGHPKLIPVVFSDSLCSTLQLQTRLVTSIATWDFMSRKNPSDDIAARKFPASQIPSILAHVSGQERWPTLLCS